jgi:hypothetical protein
MLSITTILRNIHDYFKHREVHNKTVGTMAIKTAVILLWSNCQ